VIAPPRIRSRLTRLPLFFTFLLLFALVLSARALSQSAKQQQQPEEEPTEERDDYEDPLDASSPSCDSAMALRAPGAVSAGLAGTTPCVPLAALRFQSPAAALAHRYAQRNAGTALLRHARGAAAVAASSSSSSQPAACSAEMCTLDHAPTSGPSAAFAAPSHNNNNSGKKRRSVAAAATPPKMGAAAAGAAKLAASGLKPGLAWYQQHADVWTELGSEEEFYAFLDAEGDDRLILVGERGASCSSRLFPPTAPALTEKDAPRALPLPPPQPTQNQTKTDFYATWCSGCKNSFPDLTRVASDPNMRARVRFAKVCVDVLKGLVKSAGVKGLPAVQLYAPRSHRALVTLDVPPSRVKHLRASLETALAAPWRLYDYRADPNGFLVPVALTPAQIAAREQEAAASRERAAAPPAADVARAEAAKALEGSTASLFDQLMASAGGGGSSSSGSDSDKPAPAEKPAFAAAAAEKTAPSATGPPPSIYEEGLSLARADFLQNWPNASRDYGYGNLPEQGIITPDGPKRIDSLYEKEVGVRMKRGEHYLDYTGASVYCQSQLQSVFSELSGTMFGNPHSANPSSSLTSDAVEDARDRVLRFFNADPKEYQVVFTRSATGALKLVGETFPWAPGSEFVYLRENHNSVLGMREYALRAGGRFVALNEAAVEAWLADARAVSPDALGAPHGAEDAWWTRASSPPPLIPAHHAGSMGSTADSDEGGFDAEVVGGGGAVDPLAASLDNGADNTADADADAAAALDAAAARAAANAARATAAAAALTAAGRPTFNLFAFPLEDNFAGVKYPHRWVEAVRRNKSSDQRPWRVLVDAAAYVPTQPLDLRQVRPDFVSLSFYKMFGYPTGLGALIVRADAAAELEKVFWGGGTVALATSADDFHVLKCRPSDRLEDGTVAFLDITALKHGFGTLDKLGGMKAVQAHVAVLTEWLYARLAALKHSNGQRVVAVFGKHGRPDSRSVQGGILNFEVLRPDGRVFSYKTFEREAAEAGFHVRTGSECNPGACFAYLDVKEEEIETLAGKKEGCQDDVEWLAVQRKQGKALLIGPDIVAEEEGVPAFAGSIDSGSESDEEVILAPRGPSPASAGPSPVAGGRAAAASAVAAGVEAAEGMEWVQVPLGSVRASLGYMSTFTDVYALARFVELRYKDRVE
jgi:molybdenum cofactor sulfurtransferase